MAPEAAARRTQRSRKRAAGREARCPGWGAPAGSGTQGSGAQSGPAAGNLAGSGANSSGVTGSGGAPYPAQPEAGGR
ncbi:hypothetical protein PDUR_22575 [Paenibacillus durus]|uniref:Uncharacterized protein n=1 Tax=Paenibacillus durus TaxID=44251 RepID=A0A089HUG2_PAEDU|nr:hypothetical protein PDUR_22570 [Paenibacillus durus]AIQ14376.1 hypothetical protein PDUR_22575 [Paenibacillus durus]